MTSIRAQHASDRAKGPAVRKAAAAWVVAAIFYFYQYVLRSSPSVMIPGISVALGVSAIAVASVVGLFYVGYSLFSFVAGATMDGVGPLRVLPIAATLAGIGAFFFASGGREAASIGRFLQGAGGVFAPVGAIYIATTRFPPSRAATLIGATQMFGMLGGAAGQFLVAHIVRGVAWDNFWIGLGFAGLGMGAILFLLLPEQEQQEGGLKTTAEAFRSVFRNPQSILCGVIAGLLFMPTTIFDMIWGVRYLQEAHGFEYGEAVIRSATVSFGWVIGCPLLGFISDRIGRRKPVIIGGRCCCWFVSPGSCSADREFSPRIPSDWLLDWRQARPCCPTASSRKPALQSSAARLQA